MITKQRLLVVIGSHPRIAAALYLKIHLNRRTRWYTCCPPWTGDVGGSLQKNPGDGWPNSGSSSGGGEETLCSQRSRRAFVVSEAKKPHSHFISRSLALGRRRRVLFFFGGGLSFGQPARHTTTNNLTPNRFIYFKYCRGRKCTNDGHTPQIYFKCIRHKLKPNKSHFNFH